MVAERGANNYDFSGRFEGAIGNAGADVNNSVQVVNNVFQARRGERACPLPPPPPEKFGGRDKPLAELKDRLKTSQGGLTAITAVQGLGGIGKTTLAQQVAHELFYLDKAFKAVLWAELGRETDAQILLQGWAYYSDPNFNIPPNFSLPQLAHLIKSQLEGVINEKGDPERPPRVLVVLDDLWDTGRSREAARLLLEARPANSTVLLTSRDAGVVIDFGAEPQPLDRLNEAESVALLQQYFGKGFAEAQLAELGRILGGHPLALTIAAKRLLKTGESTLSRARTLPQHLAEYRRGLDSGDIFNSLNLGKEIGLPGDASLATVLSHSYALLNEDEQQSFRAIGVLPQDLPFDVSLLAALWQISPDEATGRANVLRLLSLLDEVVSETETGSFAVVQNSALSEAGSPLWYSTHPLLHSYARALLRRHAELETARPRYHDFIIDLCSNFGKLPPQDWKPFEAYLPYIKDVGAAFVTLTTQAEAEAGEELLRRALHFASNVNKYLHRRREVKQLDWLEMGLKVSRRLQDRSSEAFFLHYLGFAYSAYGKKHKALEYYEQALTLRRELNEQRNEATTLHNIGLVYRNLGNYQQALKYFELSLIIFTELHYKEEELTTLINVGTLYNLLEEQPKALQILEQILPMWREAGNQDGEAHTLHAIGRVYNDRGEYRKAQEYFEKALPLQRQVGDRSGEAHTLYEIGRSYNNLGQKEKALEYYHQSLPLVQMVGDRHLEAVACSNIRILYQTQGRLEEAIIYMERCVRLKEELDYLPPNEVEQDRATLEWMRAELSW